MVRLEAFAADEVATVAAVDEQNHRLAEVTPRVRVADFSAWVRGDPGAPAAESDLVAFDEANRRSWAGFPPSTELRRSISTTVAGHEVDLFGFRSDNTLCLRVVGRGVNGSPASSCAAVAALENASAPVLVVQADHAMGLASSLSTSRGPVAPRAPATFGIVADGVDTVELVADDGTHRLRPLSTRALAILKRYGVPIRLS